MNPIALCMDLILAVLLGAALVVGLRLNRRLEALKAGHADFAKAVAELDAAALKADSALKSLRAASEEAHDALLTRIETARGLILKLEKASDEAGRSARVADRTAERWPPASGLGRADRNGAAGGQGQPEAPRAPFSEPLPRRQGVRGGSAASGAPRSKGGLSVEPAIHGRTPTIADLLVDPGQRTTAKGKAADAPRAQDRTLDRSAVRKRPAAADDDLFDSVAEGVRPGLAGLMRLSLARRL